MAVVYSVEPDKSQVEEALLYFEFVGGNTTKAVRIAINRSLTPVRTLSSTKIREQVRLTATYVRQRLVIKKASNRVLTGKIETPSRGVLLSRFSTNATVAKADRWAGEVPQIPKQGIKVKVKPSGPIQNMGSSSFYMILPNSKRIAIAARKDEINPKTGRQKIDVFYGPSVSQVFRDVKEDIAPQASDRYTSELLNAMNYVLKKQYPPE